MIADNKLIKRKGEDFTIGIDYTDREPVLSGATLTSGTCSAVRVSDLATDNSILDSTALTVSGNKFLVRCNNGAAIGQDYLVTFVCNFSNGDTLNPTILIAVR